MIPQGFHLLPRVTLARVFTGAGLERLKPGLCCRLGRKGAQLSLFIQVFLKSVVKFRPVN